MMSPAPIFLICLSGDASSKTEGRCSLCEPSDSSNRTSTVSTIFVMTDVVYSVGVRVDTITKHETLTSFACKLGLMMMITNPTGCTEYFEVTHIGFLTDH